MNYGCLQGNINGRVKEEINKQLSTEYINERRYKGDIKGKGENNTIKDYNKKESIIKAVKEKETFEESKRGDEIINNRDIDDICERYRSFKDRERAEANYTTGIYYWILCFTRIKIATVFTFVNVNLLIISLTILVNLHILKILQFI